jgi:hypothetical protein
LPNQYASAAAVDTPDRRNVTATGAVQQVHIIDGVLHSPPAIALAIRPRRLSTRSNHRRGTSDCTAALISNAATSAFHTAWTYAEANDVPACHDGGSPGCTPPTPRMLDPLHAPLAARLLVRAA